jgi:hexosaminidase
MFIFSNNYFHYFSSMKKCISIIFLCCLSFILKAQTGASALIPAPVSVQEKGGFFALSSKTTIKAIIPFNNAAALFAKLSGCKLSVKTGNNQIIFAAANSKDLLGKEGYQLDIKPAAIYIHAQTSQGATNAVLTLLQLRLLQPDMQKIPCAVIHDEPRFSYRGLHLDVSRNFYPKDFIKKYIDLMALYKYNTFHWHLTDNGGWRLQIKKYPLLTNTSAFRTDHDWKKWWLNGRQYIKEGEPGAYGGYYTQEDAKEIVAYAAARGITVIPEFEMPGHSEEVMAVYPQLSCTGLPYKNGELCIGNEETFTFLQNVLTEVMDIFPSTYIHVGGDEANTKPWETCPKCQQRKKELGLSNEHELQSYLIKRIEKFLIAHNRKLLGWDEILEGGLAPGATVMNWRSDIHGMEAAEQNHDVIVSNAYYLDTYQSNPNTQPEAIGGYSPIQKIYENEPVPVALNLSKTKYYIGTEACVWSEYMPTTYQVEYMAYPRAIALAETAWSAKEKKNFDNFQKRLQAHYLLLQRMDVNYYRPSSLLTLKVFPDTSNKKDLIGFISEQYKPEIHFTIDGSNPGVSSPVYQQPFYTTGKTEIKAAILKDGKMIDRPAAFTANYHKAVGKKVIYNNLWSDTYPAQKESTLTNGIEGSLTYNDKQWLGYLKDFDVTLDMDSVQSLNSLSIRFMQQPGPGVFLPSYVELLFSTDGKKFTSFSKQINSIPFDEPKTIFKSFSFDLKNMATRYIRIVAANVKNEYMFTDEIIVY